MLSPVAYISFSMDSKWAYILKVFLKCQIAVFFAATPEKPKEFSFACAEFAKLNKLQKESFLWQTIITIDLLFEKNNSR